MIPTHFNIMKLTLSATLLLIGLLINTVSAVTLQSNSQQVPLIELYTSEGCSSCPPADRWMNSLLDEDELWREYVPIAFHVDYWDYIGWPDRFASKEYSQRQRRYATEFNEPTVYTPGMRKAGDLWRNWLYVRSPSLSDAEEVGVLSLNIENDGSFTADFAASEATDQPNQLNIAILGQGLSTDVKRGENRGKTLDHNFVVLAITTIGSSTNNQWNGSLPTPSIIAPNYAVAAWVTRGGSLKPIQVVGGELNSLPDLFAVE